MILNTIKLIFSFGFISILLGCSLTDNTLKNVIGQSAKFFSKPITKTLDTNYLLYLPEQYAATEETEKKWPLILFLHGSGERGDDISKVEIHGPPKLVAKENQHFPFVIVSPQIPDTTWWGNELELDTLDALLNHIVDNYAIDEDRIYLTGLSMGGYGTWSLATQYPDRFAAIAPICGGGNTESVPDIAHVPAWVFHGAKDDVVNISESEKMVDATEKAGGRVKFTVYPEAKHDSWTETYENPELYEWFLQHRRSANMEIKAKNASL